MSEELYATLTAEQTLNATIAIAKGDKGDKGDAYIITEADKQEIKEALSGDISELKSDMAGKLTEPSTGIAVGKYFRIAEIDELGHAVLEAVDASQVGVQDVKVSGASIVTDSVANVPFAGFRVPGLINYEGYNTIQIQQAVTGISVSNGHIDVFPASEYNIGRRTTGYNAPIVPANLDYAVRVSMCDGKGAAWTDTERLACLLRMGCTVDENGFVKWTAQEVTK